MAMGLLFFAVPAGALIPDDIVVGTVPVWVTAGGGDTATVTAWVNSSTSDETSSTSGSTSFESVGVDFVVNNTLGSISPAHAETGSDDGRATAVFRYGIRSGDVNVTARMALDASVINYTDLHIDHATPYQINNTWYSPKVTAGGEAKIIVRMVDRYGNVVDSKREDALNVPSETENLTFVVGSPGGGAVFANGRDEITVPVDENGNATATLRVDTAAGENIVYIQPPAPIRGEYITIRGAADGVPAGITCTVNPSGASVPANGKDKITLMYELTDTYGNPAVGQSLWVNSSGLARDSKFVNSSYLGQVWVTYGPEEEVGAVPIIATAGANASVTNTTKVEFTSTDPVQMLLTASPQTMPSRDVKDGTVSELRAKVMDVRGNPVAGETVTFEIVSNRSAPYNQTVDQVLEAEFAITNSDGSAIVKFRPGAFTNDREAPGWDAAANGTATVQATWENVTRGCHVTRDIDLTWMNYPYLSVETEVSRATVSVNSTDGVSNTTDVTIRLKGDGWALQPDPIDVVLCTDRSGSMLYDNPDRMHSVREAAKEFVDNMSERDKVGLVTFGRNTGSGNKIYVPGERSFDNPGNYINNIYKTPKRYLDYATVDLPLTDTFSSVKTELDNIVPDYGTPMRGGIYKAINELSVNGSSDTVKAVILLSDGDYNWYGDPLARGTGYSNYDPTNYGDLTQNYYKFGNLSDVEQNLSVYARHKNVAIYSIGYANSISSDGIATLKTLAESTDGKYYNGSAANIGAVYTAIAGELKTEAGVDTTMTVFENVEVNGAPRSAADVFDYNYTPGISTHILNETKTDVLYNDTINQINDWKENKQLRFDIGTVRLNQNWTTTFRVAVKPSYEADGDDNNINIFGPGATLSFNNDINTLPLPATFITVYPDLTNTGITSASLDVEFTGPGSDSGPYADVVPLTWTTAYNGTQDVGISLAWSRYEDGRQPSTFFTKTLPAGTFGDDEMITNSTLMDARGLAPGRCWITVTASACDAKTDEATTDVWVHTRDTSSAFIKIG
jgi:hypothetical protein